MVRLVKAGEVLGGAAVLASSGLPDVPAQFGMYVILSVGGMLWIATMVKSLMGKGGGATIPQPLITEIRQEMISRKEFHAEIRELTRRLESEQSVLRGSEQHIHSRIDGIATALAEQRGELKGIRTDLSKVVDKILKTTR